MTTQRPLLDDFGEEIEPTLDGLNCVWDAMKARGLPLTGEQYLRMAFGNTPDTWNVGPEDMIDVPREIREEVERILILVQTPPLYPRAVPDLQNLPEDPAEAAIQAGLAAHGRKWPH